MIIACVIGSRADIHGVAPILMALDSRGINTVIHEVPPLVREQRNMPADNADAVVLLGDREEIASVAVEYRGQNIPICHIHAGEISGQEPDDTYRDVISRMSKLLFVPHKSAHRRAVSIANETLGVKVFNCGSPFITSAYNTELVPVEWPKGDGKKVFVAFNPLPENKAESTAIGHALYGVVNSSNYRFVTISPNTDRHWGTVMVSGRDMASRKSLSHAKYLSYMASADVIIGNTSAGCVEGCYFGTPYLCVGSRQFCREYGPHVRWCKPKDMGVMLEETLKMDKIPSDTFGKPDSADRIAETLMNEVKKLGK